MKMKRLIIVGLVLALAGITHAADVLKIQNVSMASGESVNLNIELTNTTTNLMGWQCDISLPEGLTLELKSNGKPVANLGNRFSTTEHKISSSRLSNGDYRFIATSMDGEAIPDKSGILFTVILKADASLLSGTKLTGLMKNIEFNTQDNQKLTFDNVSFTIDIENTSVMKGDVNGDGDVDIADAVCIVNHVVGKANTTFMEAVADANGDGDIDIADAVHIVNLVVGKINVLSRPVLSPELDEKEPQ